METNFTRLQSDVLVLEEKKRHSTEEVDNINSRITTLSDATVLKEKDIQRIMQTLYDNTKKLADEAINQLEQSLEASLAQNLSLEEETNGVLIKIQEFQKLFNEAEGTKVTVEEQCREMQQQVKVLEQEVKDIRDQISLQKKKEDDLNCRIQSIQDSSSHDVVAIQLQILKLKKEKDELQRTTSENNSFCDTLIGKKDALSFQLQALIKELSSCSEEKGLLVVEVNQSTQFVEREQKAALDIEKHKEVEQILRQIEETRKDVDELQHQQDDMISDIKSKIAALEEKASKEPDDLFEEDFSEVEEDTDEEVEIEYNTRLSVQKNIWSSILEEQRKILQDLVAKREEKSKIVVPSSTSKKIQKENQTNTLFTDDFVSSPLLFSQDFNSNSVTNNLFSQDLTSTPIDLKSKVKDMVEKEVTPVKQKRGSKTPSTTKTTVKHKTDPTPKSKEKKSNRKSEVKSTPSTSKKAKSSKKKQDEEEGDLSIFDFLG